MSRPWPKALEVTHVEFIGNNIFESCFTKNKIYKVVGFVREERYIWITVIDDSNETFDWPQVIFKPVLNKVKVKYVEDI